MSKDKLKSLVFFLLLSAGLTGLDQWTKLLAVRFLSEKPSVPVIAGVFELTFTVNYGAAFGMLQNRQILFLITTPLILLAVLYLYLKLPKSGRYFPLRVIGILLFSGAAGNLIDRAVRGYVVDFFYFKLIHFPVFNVADCYVTVATVLLFVFYLFVYKGDELDFLFQKKQSERSGE